MSKIRIIKASSLYPAYLASFVAAHPGMEPLTSTERAGVLGQDFFAGAGVWKDALEALGDFEVWEIALNAGFVQQAWAAERKIPYGAESWVQDIFLAQCREYRPDVLFALGFDVLTPDFLRRIKQDLPGLRVVSYEGIALAAPRRFSATDLMLSCAEFILEPYRAAGLRCALLPHGFDRRILACIEQRPARYPATFIGSLVLGPNNHQARLRWLDQVARACPVELFLQMDSTARLAASRLKQALKERAAAPLRAAREEVPAVYRLNLGNHGGVFGLRMFQALSDSGLTLNRHIDAAGNHAANMRLFEATGAGVCLLTDWKPNLGEIFEIDREVIAYRSTEECVDKLRFLLAHPAECQAVGRAGQQRTLRDYDSRRATQQLAPLLRDLAA